MNATAKPLAEWLAAYNRSEIARRIGVDVTTVSRWYRGTSKPSGVALQALARFLRCDANDIIVTPKSQPEQIAS